MAYPEAWTERLFIAVARKGQTGYTNFTSDIDKVTINRGERGFESIALLNGGRIPKFTPEADTEVTMTLYPSSVAIGASGSMDQFFNRTYDDEEPLSTSPTLYRDKYKVVILWTDYESQSDAITAVPSGSAALRYSLQNGYITKCTPTEFGTDGVLSYDVSFKLPAFNKSATANITVESSDGGQELPVVANYS